MKLRRQNLLQCRQQFFPWSSGEGCYWVWSWNAHMVPWIDLTLGFEIVYSLFAAICCAVRSFERLLTFRQRVY